MIEIDNLKEIAAELDKTTVREEIETFRAQSAQQPGKMRAQFQKSRNEYRVRDLLELLLEEADNKENIIVITFQVGDCEGKCQGTGGETMMVINSNHAAMHAVQILQQAAQKLGHQVLREMLDMDGN